MKTFWLDIFFSEWFKIPPNDYFVRGYRNEIRELQKWKDDRLICSVKFHYNTKIESLVYHYKDLILSLEFNLNNTLNEMRIMNTQRTFILTLKSKRMIFQINTFQTIFDLTKEFF